MNQKWSCHASVLHMRVKHQPSHITWQTALLQKSTLTYYLTNSVITKVNSHILPDKQRYYKGQPSHITWQTAILPRSTLTYYLTNSVITKDAIILNIKYSWHRNWHMYNKNVDIKFSAHDAFLELPSSGTLKIERWESQII
jgi:hypothetical protein